TPYADGKFNLECCLSRDYPFVPPLVRFTTRIHHPNIDEQGRICIEILKEGTAPGRWKATSNLRMALAQIRQLLAEPNPDDPLVADTARELKADPALFRRRARAMTLQHA
ncbi:ubiquitin-conjugating enzyme/RWD-like protein, partial [Blastocladiella britannica]